MADAVSNNLDGASSPQSGVSSSSSGVAATNNADGASSNVGIGGTGQYNGIPGDYLDVLTSQATPAQISQQLSPSVANPLWAYQQAANTSKGASQIYNPSNSIIVPDSFPGEGAGSLASGVTTYAQAVADNQVWNPVSAAAAPITGKGGQSQNPYGFTSTPQTYAGWTWNGSQYIMDSAYPGQIPSSSTLNAAANNVNGGQATTSASTLGSASLSGNDGTALQATSGSTNTSPVVNPLAQPTLLNSNTVLGS